MPKIKTKGYLLKPYVMNEAKIRIAFCLYQADSPLRTSEIAKDTKLSKQLIYYHLPKLIEDGVVIRDLEGKYILQPFFYNSESMESIYSSMCPIISLIQREFIVDELSVEDEQGMLNCIQILLHFVSIEVQKLEKE